MIPLHLDAGRYRLFSNPGRSAGALCRECPGEHGFIVTDSTTIILRWIEQHEFRAHPVGRPLAAPAAPAAPARVPAIPRPRRPLPDPHAADDEYTGDRDEIYQSPPPDVEGFRFPNPEARPRPGPGQEQIAA